MRGYFEGLYFKHQHQGRSIALIPGISSGRSFIQVITDQASHMFYYPPTEFAGRRRIQIGNSLFSEQGITLNIHQGGSHIEGQIHYTGLTPLKSDIMGPFRFFPMQCRHMVVSLHHRLSGQLRVNGQVSDFTGGTGYIEGDRGRSFPKSYTWIHCNEFHEKASIVASVADIPFGGVHFTGCIAVVYLKGKEHRLATYLGVKILRADADKIILCQGKYRLEIDIYNPSGHELLAPVNGQMKRVVKEQVACRAHFKFYIGGSPVFDAESEHASFERA